MYGEWIHVHNQRGESCVLLRFQRCPQERGSTSAVSLYRIFFLRHPFEHDCFILVRQRALQLHLSARYDSFKLYLKVNNELMVLNLVATAYQFSRRFNGIRSQKRCLIIMSCPITWSADSMFCQCLVIYLFRNRFIGQLFRDDFGSV